METKLNQKGVAGYAPTVAAILAFAMAFTLNACGGDGGGGGDDAPSSSSQPSHEHTWGDWAVTAAATCETAGTQTRTCTGDNTHKETKEIAKLDWEWVVTTPATPTKAGLETKTCPGNASPPSVTRPLYPKCNGFEYDPDEKLCDDRGNKLYSHVTIGAGAIAQTWMTENLNYKVTGSLCYDDDTGEDSEGNCEIYGRLYDWATAMALGASCNSTDCSGQVNDKHRGICPSGWHIPSNEEWDALYRFADGTSGTSSPYDSPTAGKHLKAANGWNSYSGIVNLDSYGFSALPGGYGNSGGGFNGVGNRGYWWSSSEDDSNYAYYRYMSYIDEYANWHNYDKSNLQSVRCVQD
ncbi:MAG: hypothetical protein LBH25_02080 [Fibromonadaceae bacterium]|jgi:uncharacterized protein (TIGR02145 family)|nr:hypothetical protein [Fibromonadaceae bacterium]